MSLPPQFLDELRARLPASEVIGRSVRLARRGREQVGLCPFHNEKTPSFTVSDDKAFFHCFGCGAHGDVIGFVMQHDGLSFPEAVERLAAEAGLEVPRPTPEARAQAAHQATLQEVLEAAAVWFARALRREQGASARDYLRERGLGEDTIGAFRIGFAPGQRRALASFLAGEGVEEALALEAGLLRRADEGGTTYDFFRARVMFPIADARGRIIGFGGRVLGDGRPKYINSPESAVFRKGRTLYNLAGARRPARDAGTVIVAEGYMDVIALSRAGFAHAVAPLGTALTEDQIAALWRLAAEPVLCLDGDAAGRRAAARAAERALPLLAPGRSLRFAFLPEGEDPDSLIGHAGPEALAAYLERAERLVDLLWRHALAPGHFDTPERRAGLRRALDQIAARIRDQSVRGLYLHEFRRRFDAAYAAPARSARRRGPATILGPDSARHRVLSATAVLRVGDAEGARRERLLLVTLLNHPALLHDVAEELAALRFETPGLDRLRRAIADLAAAGTGPLPAALRQALAESGLAREVDRLLAPAGWAGGGIAEPFARPEADDGEAAHGWGHMATLHRRAAIEAELRAAEAALAEDTSEEALAHLIAVRHRLDLLDRGQDAPAGGQGGKGLASLPSGTT
jgi:DNA primase